MAPFLDVSFPLFCGRSPRWPSSSRLCVAAPSPHRLPILVLSLLALTRFLPSHPKVADSEEPCQMPVALQTGHSTACLPASFLGPLRLSSREMGKEGPGKG